MYIAINENYKVNVRYYNNIKLSKNKETEINIFDLHKQKQDVREAFHIKARRNTGRQNILGEDKSRRITI